MHVLPKLFEVRDVGTFIPVIAIRLSCNYEAESYLLGRAGFEVTKHGVVEGVVLFGKLDGSGELRSAPHDWVNGTMRQAHQHVQDNWHSLMSGEVIDVEHVRGDSAQPKESERLVP